tara:strand:+ start:273 stop:464 length:192 start_codon:yes stop_codon:yes gene_type:complete
MAIKVNDFIIQAKIREQPVSQLNEALEAKKETGSSAISDSVKQEIIDECVERLSDLIDEKLNA